MELVKNEETLKKYDSDKELKNILGVSIYLYKCNKLVDLVQEKE